MQIQKILQNKLYLKLMLIFALAATNLQALPFNDDMVDSQLKTGQIMRPKVEGTIAKGSLDIDFESWEVVEKLTNPKEVTASSVKHGERLFNVNCLPCHGTPKIDGYEKGLVGQKMGPFVPNLAEERFVQMTDGLIFGTIRNGSRSQIMPKIGWKMTMDETWDIVNYVRSTQMTTAKKEDKIKEDK
jgi:mono/diheme cytochrome c family protein